ncbi:hypothetical protein F2P81_008113 [Scophthalmus maximus]|uniref:Uncharacterized protein n=1 Tax=Scophthalmus maximus TaxID=52904 RepID=A0A6A4T6E4_SCOMX|nr:hypothetical protein F2P81_008113 [Scophthalmus maximus]
MQLTSGGGLHNGYIYSSSAPHAIIVKRQSWISIDYEKGSVANGAITQMYSRMQHTIITSFSLSYMSSSYPILSFSRLFSLTVIYRC